MNEKENFSLSLSLKGFLFKKKLIFTLTCIFIQNI